MVNFGTVLFHCFFISGFSIEEAEAETDITNLEQIEAGTYSPSVEAIEKLSRIYEIPLSSMFTIVESSQTKHMSSQEVFYVLSEAWMKGHKEKN